MRVGEHMKIKEASAVVISQTERVSRNVSEQLGHPVAHTIINTQVAKTSVIQEIHGKAHI